MKVLLILEDLYENVGGGQTVYKKIIESNPDITFFYFRNREKSDALRPSNVHTILLAKRCSVNCLAPPPYPLYKLEALQQANQFARSVAGQNFDVVDIPDFHICGSFFRDVFSHHRVQFGRIVLSMHGNISISNEMNWGSPSETILSQRLLEKEQFHEADAIYALSSRYILEWKKLIPRTIHYVDPIHFIEKKDEIVVIKNNNQIKPSLYCIGRTEKRKGNDIFVELIRWMRPGSFELAAHIGDQDYSYGGIGSKKLLQDIAKKRGIEIDYLPSMNRKQLGELFSKRSIVVLPVRYDTFNLIALEALFSGCLVAVSSRAGVCDYLDEVYPGLPYFKIDFDHFDLSIPGIQDLIDHYDDHHQKLLAYLANHSVGPQKPLDMKEIYKSPLPLEEQNIVNRTVFVPYVESVNSLKNFLLGFLNFMNLLNFAFSTHHFLQKFKRVIIEKLDRISRTKFFLALFRSRNVSKYFSKLAKHDIFSVDGLEKKLGAVCNAIITPFFRCNFWLEIARIQRILGNKALAVTYELRILRLSGKDSLGLIPGILSTLRSLGYLHEAEAVKALYMDPARAEENVYQYLIEAESRNCERKDKPFERLEDHRSEQPPKVSVIVSLYNAADKLSFFLELLVQQTLWKEGLVEVILIDSGSPTDEYRIIQGFFEKPMCNAVYLRSHERETIQAAWNRGIGLARAPYLVFLGVDETLYPEALDVLSRELDQNPQVDWVMANSIVTAVEASGIYKNDLMMYDRTGATKDHTYLETCYLSWVGGMYRKTIHERYGFYDETFRAAGDTEFKNRVLPHIDVKFIPKTLGVFLNYPDGNTTASSRAEIEDLRAWYIHRSLGGIRYAFRNRSVEEVEALLCQALGYRKSYGTQRSSDVEYASLLARYIQERDPGSHVANAVATGLNVMLEQLREIELMDRVLGRYRIISQLWKVYLTSKMYQKQHKKTLHRKAFPSYNILNDNRYEQHFWLWESR